MEIHGSFQSGAIDVTIDGVRLVVPDNMENRHRYQIWDEWEMAPVDPENPDGGRVRVNTIPPYVPPEVDPTPQPYKLYKSTFIRRMKVTDEVDEAQILESVLANAPSKLRMLFNSVEYFVSTDELFLELHDVIAQALTSDRASALLAPEV